MRDGVGQQTLHDLIRFCDDCCAVGYVVLLSLCSTSSACPCASLEKIVNHQCKLLHTRDNFLGDVLRKRLADRWPLATCDVHHAVMWMDPK